MDIAKEAADIILLEKSLMVLEQGVIEGRRTFVNMLKYIRMTASSNFGNVLSVLVASAFLPFLPMLPIHLLVQNLLYDLSQTAIPFDNVDDEALQAPQHWAPQELLRFMLIFGPDQFGVRHPDLRADVEGVPRADAGDADAVPDRLVRRGPAVADAGRAHDPHPRPAVHRQPRRRAAAG